MGALAAAVALALLQEPVEPEPAPAFEPQAPAVLKFQPAVEEERAPSRKLAERPESGPSLGGFLVASVVVVALLLGAFLLLKRFGRNSRLLGAGGPIRVLSRKGLGGRHDLFLVEVGPRVLLLGATRDRLSTLGEFRNPDEVAVLRADAPGRSEGTFRESFRETLDEGIRAEEKPSPDGVYASISEELAEIGRTVRAWKA
jgi:flagellar biogenesis protein FliO